MHRFKSTTDIRIAEKELAEQDPQMAKIIQHYGPCSIQPWSKDLYTSLTSSIVSQQLSVKAANTIFLRLIERCGLDNVLQADQLITYSVDELRSCGLSHAKAKYCMALAHAIVSEELNLEKLIESDDEDILNRLVQLPGIGRWTAQMFLIFAVGSRDVLATADLGLKRGMQRYLHQDDYPTIEEFKAKSVVWKPYRSIASWYLWRLAD